MRHAMVMNMAAPHPDPAHSHQLWLVPAQGTPHSLGVIDPSRPQLMAMPAALVGQLRPGATVAISLEPLGGSPREGPSGPVVATATLNQI
jgi:anti-sigma-K factor RskA